MNPFALSMLNLASSIYQDPEEALIATAQAVLETGSGKSVPGGNLFGIKGPGGTHRTWEVVNGQPVTTTASFREYGSPEESIAGRMEFLRSNPRYGKAGYFDATTAEEKADALQRAGYATDPNYAAKLKSIVSRLRGSSVQTFPYQAPGLPPPAQPPAPEPQPMRPTSRYADIFSGLQGRPGADPLAQAAFAMADVMAPPGQRTGAAREFVMGDRHNIATQIQLARLMQEEERLAAERAEREAEIQGMSKIAAGIQDPKIREAMRIGALPPSAIADVLGIEGPDSAPKYGTTPRYERDSDGTIYTVRYATDGTKIREPTQGTPFAVESRTPGYLGNVERAKAIGKAEGVGQAEARASLPDIETQVGQSLETIDALLADDEGMRRAVGFVSMLPTVPGSKAADYEARLGQLYGQNFLAAYERLRGGGQITEVEGQKAQQAISDIATSQSVEAHRDALMRLREVVNAGLKRARDKAGLSTEPLTGESGSDAWVPIGDGMEYRVR